MTRVFSLLLVGLLVLSACAVPTGGPSGNAQNLGNDGKPLPKAYKIRNANKVQLRMLDAVNALRSASGTTPVVLNSELTAAAATHARDMSIQNRAWNFGSDGSSPIDRAMRAGYTGRVMGENVSETFETELETLGAWMQVPGNREVLLVEGATNMGFSWYQEKNGKIWWTLVMGGA